MSRSLITILTAASFLGSCAMKKTEEIRLEGKLYSIPKEHIVSISLDGPMYHLSLKGVGDSYRLIYSSKNERSNQTASGAPTIAEINDGFSHNTELVKDTVVPVVCKKNSRLSWNCGFLIHQDGLKWAVLMSRDDLPELELIRAKAIQQIQEYRR